MFNFNNRDDDRKNIAVHAFVSDLEERFEIRCVIRDASKHGCLLISSVIQKLPTMIHITPEGFDKPLCGKIVWRSGRMAGVNFVRENRNPNQALIDMLLSLPKSDDDGVFLLTKELEIKELEIPTFEQRMKKYGNKKT